MKELLLPVKRGNHWFASARQALVHVLITLIAVGVALSLPVVAQYILFQWWPRVAKDANLLIINEIGLAVGLLLLFNVVRMAWKNRYQARVADAAALVYAREKHSWIARWRERRLVKHLPAARDANLLTLTGFDTFSGAGSLLHEPLKSAYEIRVMLLNPVARGAQRRVDSLPIAVTLQSFTREIESSIAYLSRLRTLGKNVTLKFYEQEPFWKVAALGDHVWIQYCHSGFEVKHEPEYVFALNHADPRRGLFVPFYMYFLEQWNDPAHPLYDFDTRELVYRDRLGRATYRVAFGTERAGEEPPAPAPQYNLAARNHARVLFSSA